MAKVIKKDSESFEKFLKRFKNRVYEEKIIETFNDNRFFDKKKKKKS